MSDKLDIGEPVAEICKRLGLDKANVAHLDISPTSVTADVFKLRKGAKYVERNEAALETLNFEVVT